MQDDSIQVTTHIHMITVLIIINVYVHFFFFKKPTARSKATETDLVCFYTIKPFKIK